MAAVTLLAVKRLPEPGSEQDVEVLDGEETTEESLSLDRLPDLALVHAFSFLAFRDKVRVELVCKRWLRLSRASWSLLTEFSTRRIHSFKARIREEHVQRAKAAFSTLLERMRHPLTRVTSLKSLEVDDRLHWLPPSADPSNQPQREEEKDAWRSGTSQPSEIAAFKPIGSLCPNLETLRISLPRDEENRSAAELLRGLFELDCNGTERGGRFPRLRELSVSWADDLEDSLLRRMIDRCPLLETIRVRCSPQIKGFFLPPSIRLRSLDLTACTSVCDEAIDALVDSYAGTISELALSFCRQMSRRGFERLGVLIGRKTLRVLKLRKNLRDVEWKALFADGDNRLRELDISCNLGVDDQKLCDILAYLPDLEKLSVVSNVKVTNWFPHKWFKAGTNHDGPDQMVGRRRKFAPLKLFCYDTRIAEKQFQGKKDFPWTLSFQMDGLLSQCLDGRV